MYGCQTNLQCQAHCYGSGGQGVGDVGDFPLARYPCIRYAGEQNYGGSCGLSKEVFGSSFNSSWVVLAGYEGDNGQGIDF